MLFFSKKTIIELFGLPGSGKTTLAKKLENEGAYIVKTNIVEAIFLHMLFCILFPFFSAKTFFFLLKESKDIINFFRKYLFIYVRRNASFLKARLVSFEKVIIDEGLLQNILSFAEHHVSEVWIDRYIHLMPKGNQIVIINIEHKVRHNYLEKRSVNKCNHKHDERDILMEDNFNTISHILQKDKLPPLIKGTIL